MANLPKMTAEQSLGVQKGNASQTQAKIIIPKQLFPERLASAQETRYENETNKAKDSWFAKLCRLIKDGWQRWQ